MEQGSCDGGGQGQISTTLTKLLHPVLKNDTPVHLVESVRHYKMCMKVEKIVPCT